MKMNTRNGKEKEVQGEKRENRLVGKLELKELPSRYTKGIHREKSTKIKKVFSFIFLSLFYMIFIGINKLRGKDFSKCGAIYMYTKVIV